MQGLLGSDLTYASVLATVVLFVALAVSSYAALRAIGANLLKDALTEGDIDNLPG
jgi:hypothetical protein